MASPGSFLGISRLLLVVLVVVQPAFQRLDLLAARSEHTTTVRDVPKNRIEENRIKLIENVKGVKIARPVGTGQTTGHIASIVVENLSDIPVIIEPQSFYIPSYGRYQSYVGRIPEGISVSPSSSSSVPVIGYCTDIRLPPVPLGSSMPNLVDWIVVLPVGESIAVVPPAAPEPMNPPGATRSLATSDLIPIRLIPGPGVSEFTPELIDEIVNSDEFFPDEIPSGAPRMTWPGTDIEMPGRFDMENTGPLFASVVVTAMNLIEDILPDIQADDDYNTPFSADSVREAEAIGQQTMWIYTAGGTYGKEDFSDKLYSQYETVTGNDRNNLKQAEQEKLEQGVDDFFNSFMATGLEAKVIKEGSGDLNVLISDDRCGCDTLTFTLSRKSKGIYVSLDSYESTTFGANGSDKTAENDTIPEDEFAEIELKIHDVKLTCHCESGSCPHYPEMNADETEINQFNFSAKNSPTEGASIADESSDGKEFTFTAKTKDNFKNAYVYFKIKAYCQSADCKRKTCVRQFRRNFVREPAEEK